MSSCIIYTQKDSRTAKGYPKHQIEAWEIEGITCDKVKRIISADAGDRGDTIPIDDYIQNKAGTNKKVWIPYDGISRLNTKGELMDHGHYKTGDIEVIKLTSEKELGWGYK